MLLVCPQVLTMMMYAMTMDGGLKFAIYRYVCLAYGGPAALLVALRWKSWSAVELVFLRWGWAPVIAVGVPLAAPELLAAGLVRRAFD
jgi:hypothetical protein